MDKKLNYYKIMSKIFYWLYLKTKIKLFHSIEEYYYFKFMDLFDIYND